MGGSCDMSLPSVPHLSQVSPGVPHIWPGPSPNPTVDGVGAPLSGVIANEGAVVLLTATTPNKGTPPPPHATVWLSTLHEDPWGQHTMCVCVRGDVMHEGDLGECIHA